VSTEQFRCDVFRVETRDVRVHTHRISVTTHDREWRSSEAAPAVWSKGDSFARRGKTRPANFSVGKKYLLVWWRRREKVVSKS
jgi:hypothetical protein